MSKPYKISRVLPLPFPNFIYSSESILNKTDKPIFSSVFFSENEINDINRYLQTFIFDFSDRLKEKMREFDSQFSCPIFSDLPKRDEIIKYAKNSDNIALKKYVKKFY